jgi:chromosome segregation ATPase
MSNSEVNQETSEVTIESLQEQLAQKDSQLNDIQSQFSAVKSKADELLDETKKAKAQRREAEEVAKREAEEKARKKGDYEQLLNSSESEREKLAKELTSLRNGISQEKVNAESLKIAADMADGSNAEILSEFISRRLQWTDDGLKVLDEAGNLTIATVDHLKNEFRSNAKYKSLIRGIKSTGGGATQTDNGVAETNSKSAQEIRDMDPLERGKFFKKGGTIKNEI